MEKAPACRAAATFTACALLFLSLLPAPADAHAGGGDVFVGGSDVYAVDWNPNGTLFAAGTRGGDITIWNGVSHNQTPVASWHAHNGPVNQVSFSPDGARLASVSGAYRTTNDEKTLKIWDVASGALLQNLSGHRDWVTAVAWSSNGNLIASASGVDDHDNTANATGELFVWNSYGGLLLWNSSGLPSFPNRIDWAPDGSWIASIGHLSDIWLFNASTRVRIQINQSFRDILGHASHGYAIAWSPDSKLLVAGFSRDIDDLPDGLTDIGPVVLIDPFSRDVNNTADQLATAAVHNKAVQWVEWDSTGQWVASCSGMNRSGQGSRVDGGEAVVYSASTMKPQNVWIGGGSWCASLSWRPNDLSFIAGNADGSVRIYYLDEDGDGCFIWQDDAPRDPAVCKPRTPPEPTTGFLLAYGLPLAAAGGVAAVLGATVYSKGRTKAARRAEAGGRRRPRNSSGNAKRGDKETPSKDR